METVKRTQYGTYFERIVFRKNGPMKSIGLIGVVLVVLGLLAFVVPIPHSESHAVKIGDAKIGVYTQTSEKLVSQKDNVKWRLLAIRAAYIRLGIIGKY